MSRYIHVIVLILILACNQTPFVEHDLKFTKDANTCENINSSFKLISNFGGERYEFSKCLPADFNKEQLVVSREGDTVVVKFPQKTANSAAFTITLDIDSYPKYNFLTIDDETIALTHSDNQ